MLIPLKYHEPYSASASRSWKLGPTLDAGEKGDENCKPKGRRKVFPSSSPSGKPNKKPVGNEETYLAEPQLQPCKAAYREVN